MWIGRGIFLAVCFAVLGGAYYLSSQGVWGASNSVTSVRSGSFIGTSGRVK